MNLFSWIQDCAMRDARASTPRHVLRARRLRHVRHVAIAATIVAGACGAAAAIGYGLASGSSGPAVHASLNAVRVAIPAPGSAAILPALVVLLCIPRRPK